MPWRCGKPCLRTFAVPSSGSVLLFPAEDALPVVKRRLIGICKSLKVELEHLPLNVITTPVVRLDIEQDRKRLRETVAELRPRLVVLDPFVRLHAIDENASGEVAQILHHLRDIQRTYHCAIALVHHAKKGAGKRRGGQALRGSSEFHAWGDSNLYLRRDRVEKLSLTIEHRAEHSPEPVPLRLESIGDTAYLTIDEPCSAPLKSTITPQQLLLNALKEAERPLRITELRQVVGIRNATVSKTLHELLHRGLIKKEDNRYSLITPL